MIQIDKDVPPPPTGTRYVKYPFGSMEIGDSFTVPKRLRNSVDTSAKSWAMRHAPNARFAVRSVDEETVRIWRIE